MSIKIITCDKYGDQVLYNSVTMQAFGIVHEDSDHDLEDFLEWLKPDNAALLSSVALNDRYYEWLQEVRDLAEAEKLADEADFKRDVAKGL